MARQAAARRDRAASSSPPPLRASPPPARASRFFGVSPTSRFFGVSHFFGTAGASSEAEYGFNSFDQRLSEVYALQQMRWSDGAADVDCAICMACFECDDAVVRLPCGGGHCFHQDCIEAWFERAPVCPTCRWDCREGREASTTVAVSVRGARGRPVPSAMPRRPPRRASSAPPPPSETAPTPAAAGDRVRRRPSMRHAMRTSSRAGANVHREPYSLLEFRP